MFLQCLTLNRGWKWEAILDFSRETPSSYELLSRPADPEPVEIINAESMSPILMICEHAGRAIPQKLDTLGLTDDQLALHIAYDIGTEKVARKLAARFGCTLIMQRYSRLVLDCNRPPDTEESIPLVSDHISIPGNQDLTRRDHDARTREIFEPFAAACKKHVAKPHLRYTYSIHSFTPSMNGLPRPWDVGFLYRRPQSLGRDLLELAGRLWPTMTLGDNEPYQVADETDWFIPACAEPRQIPHSLIEIRNDHLITDAGCEQWSDRFYELFSHFMETNDATVS